MKTLLTHRARLVLHLRFPAGICPGQGKLGNAIEPVHTAASTALNPVLLLRGTTVAGVLRHAIAATHPVKANIMFGTPCNDNAGTGDRGLPSRVAIGDATIAGPPTAIRVHNRIDPARGAVEKGALFGLQSSAPGSESTVVAWIAAEEPDDARKWAESIVNVLNSVLTLGAASARGIGSVVLAGNSYRPYDCSSIEGMKEYLNDHRTWRNSPDAGLGTYRNGKSLTPVQYPTTTFTVVCDLIVPRGQDILVASDSLREPQWVVNADGYSAKWRIPGSTLRGLFRDWCRRKLSRMPVEKRPPCAANGDAVDLFGYVDAERPSDDEQPSQMAGRLHIADAFATCGKPEEPLSGPEVQERTHVAIDRVSGGASDALLFQNLVLIAGTTFKEVSFSIRNCQPHEAAWLGGFLRALDLGLVRVGSSKAAGRLELDKARKTQEPLPERASGPDNCQESFRKALKGVEQ